MKNNQSDIAEQVATWLKEAGFDKDLSPLVAGILDIRSGLEDMRTRILPALLELKPNQKDEIMTLIVDLWLQAEHLAKHAEDIRDITAEIRDFFDTTN